VWSADESESATGMAGVRDSVRHMFSNQFHVLIGYALLLNNERVLLSHKAVDILLRFVTYLCQTAFLILTNMKSNCRS